MSHGREKENVRKIRTLLRGLARRSRPTKAQILHIHQSGKAVRSRTETGRPPKKPGAQATIADALCASFIGPGTSKSAARYQAAKALTAYAGSLPPAKLSAAHILEIEANWRKRQLAQSTTWNLHKALRLILRWLWDNHGAPKLDEQVAHPPAPRPRNVKASFDERTRITSSAPDHLRLWILLCSDLAIRSGTAANLAPQHYNRQNGTLTFRTKCDERLTLPATWEIQALIAKCNHENPESFVRQLWRLELARRNHTGPRDGPLTTAQLRRQFKQLRQMLGIRRIIPHDLRRTAAVAMLEETHDIREVQALLGHKNLQSTFWYIDHDLNPPKRRTLELIQAASKVERKKA